MPKAPATTKQWVLYVQTKLFNALEAEDLIPASTLLGLVQFDGRRVGEVDFSDPVSATIRVSSERLALEACLYLQSGERGKGSYDVTRINLEVTD